MTAYEQQIESGREVLRGILSNLASELHEPKVNELAFRATDQDLDRHYISLMDPKFNIIAKIEENDFADCPTDKTVRRKLETQLRRAVQAFFGPNN
jgi:hypothetical protein